MKIGFTAKIIFLFLLLTSQLFSAVQTELYKYNQILGITIDISNYPLFKSMIKVRHNGNPVSITKDNLIVVEDCWSGKPLSVSAPDQNGWQEISWNTKIKGPHRTADFYVVYNNEAGVAYGIDNLEDMSQIRMTNSSDDDEPDMHFGNIPVGKDSTRGIIVNAPTALVVNGQEQKIRIDSVKTHSPYFTFEWRGSVLSKEPPPTDILSPFYYRVRINFKPQENKYYKDKFSVYYEGGKVEEINLTGNYYSIPRKTVLNVVEPNGGEILRPCEWIKIKWVGSVKGIPTAVFYSIDNGSSWKYINSTMDSSLMWKVPNEPSSDVLIKVKQEFQNTSERTMKIDNVPVRKVAYSSNGLSALSANDGGKINHWDLYEYKLIQTYMIDDGRYPSVVYTSLGLDFVKNDSVFVMAYYRQSKAVRNDSIAYFKLGETYPIKKVAVEAGFLIKRMLIDAKREKLALVPKFGNTLLILNANDGSLLQRVSFNAVISGFAFNALMDEAAVSLVNGEIHILSTNDFSIKNTMDFSDLPMIIEIGLSANGKFIALGCQVPTPNILVGNRNELHVAEIPSGMIVRTMRNISSNPVGLEFNPSSNVLLIGAAAQPQISMWDLPTSEFIGSMSGNDNLLTDFKFSPEGHSIITSSTSADNFKVRFFTYPEDDSSDKVLSIVSPEIDIQSIETEPKYLATSNLYNMTSRFCNTGIVPLIIDDAWMYRGIHFKLNSNLKNDTLYPNECLDLSFYFTPADTGRLTDSLVISTCIGMFYLPMESFGLRRNISFLNTSFDFGELCLGDTIEKTFELARNDDPVDLIVNSVAFDDIFNNPFLIIKNLKDSIIKPGEKIIVTARFRPWALGKANRLFVINHSNQSKMKEQTPVTGIGIGALLDISHADLRFIPELPQRKLAVKNSTPNIIQLNAYNFSTDGIFSISNPLPVVIQPGERIELDVVWNLSPAPDVSLSFDASPCMVQNIIRLGMYSGSSTVIMPNVEADPSGQASIVINYENNSKELYKGKRFFDAVFYINPRIFLPLEVKSAYGVGTLVRNEVVNDRRLIQIRVEGDFPEKGIVAEVSGVAGLAETDLSSIELDKSSLFWGSTIKTGYANGTFKLINLCGDRRIIQNPAITILSISPNPASDEFSVDYYMDDKGMISYEIFDNLGLKILSADLINGIQGKNSVSINSSVFRTGTYKIILRKNTEISVGTVLIIK